MIFSGFLLPFLLNFQPIFGSFFWQVLAKLVRIFLIYFSRFRLNFDWFLYDFRISFGELLIYFWSIFDWFFISFLGLILEKTTSAFVPFFATNFHWDFGSIPWLRQHQTEAPLSRIANNRKATLNNITLNCNTILDCVLISIRITSVNLS